MYTLGIDPTLIVPGNVAPPFAPGALAFNITKTGESRGYMFVKDAGETTTVSGLAVVISATYIANLCSTAITAPGTGQAKIVGIMPATFDNSNIPPFAYYWAQIFGPGIVRARPSVAANAQLNTCPVAGSVEDDALTGSRVIDGLILTAASGGAAGGFTCFINWPRIGRTL